MAATFDLTDLKAGHVSTDDRHMVVYIETVRQGISFAVFYRYVKTTPFTLSEWSTFLQMSERTMQRHKSEKRPFDPIHSEKILQVALLHNFGKEVFAEQEKFYTWLETNSVALGGVKPRELLDTSFGIDLVNDELIRIEQGVLA